MAMALAACLPEQFTGQVPDLICMRFVGRKQVPGHMRTKAVFAIEVLCPATGRTQHTAHRSFPDFLRLWSDLGMGPLQQPLTARSPLRLFGPKFQAERAKSLAAFLAAALKVDPTSPILRSFLDMPAPSSPCPPCEQQCGAGDAISAEVQNNVDEFDWGMDGIAEDNGCFAASARITVAEENTVDDFDWDMSGIASNHGCFAANIGLGILGIIEEANENEECDSNGCFPSCASLFARP